MIRTWGGIGWPSDGVPNPTRPALARLTKTPMPAAEPSATPPAAASALVRDALVRCAVPARAAASGAAVLVRRASQTVAPAATHVASSTWASRPKWGTAASPANRSATPPRHGSAWSSCC